MKAYIRFVLRWRFGFLIGMGLITLAAGAMLTRAVVSSSFIELFLGEDPAYHRYAALAERFGTDELLLVAFDAPRLLEPEQQRRLKKVARQIERLPAVARVNTALDAQRLDGADGTITVTPYARAARGKGADRAAILAELAQDPFARGLLISEGGRHVALVAEMTQNSGRSAEETPALVAEVRRLFKQAGYAPDALHVVGIPAVLSAIISETYFNLERIFPIVSVVLLFTVWLLFRRFWPAAISMGVALIADIWTMGFSVLLEPKVSVLSSMIPAVILIIAFSDVIHLCSAYLLELAGGRSKEDAVLEAGSEVGAACLLTSVTTFFGFVSLSLIPTPAFRHLGVVFGFGVAVALLIAVTFVPILFSFLPEPKPWKTGTTGHIQRGLDGLLAWAARVSTGRPVAIVVVFALLTGVMAYGATQINIETDFTRRLDDEHPYQKDIEYFNEHFAGATTIEVFLTREGERGLLDGEAFAAIVRFQDAVAALPEVTRVTSLVDLMRLVHRAFKEEGALDALPKASAALAQYLLLFEMSGGEDLERLIDFERESMRMTATMPTQAFRETSSAAAEIEALAERLLPPEVEVEATGLVTLMGNWLGRILRGQMEGLSFALLSIAVLMMLGLRSIRVGLWSMIPNLTPLLFLFGYLGLFWDQVDSDVMALAIVAIGIGVDDTIHFLMRLKRESSHTDSLEQAVSRTFQYAGRGIVLTTLILVAGFLPLAFSNYLSLWMMGALLPMVFVVALLADLFLVPAMVSLGWMRFHEPASVEARRMPWWPFVLVVVLGLSAGSAGGHAASAEDIECARDTDCVSAVTERVGICHRRECLLMGEIGEALAARAFEGDEITRTFVDRGDGTVLDRRTGLVWQRGWGGARTWRPAMAYCEQNMAGLPGVGWRLPSIDELRSLILGCPSTEPGGRCAITDATPDAMYRFEDCKACGEHDYGSYSCEVFSPHRTWFWSSTEQTRWEGSEPRMTHAWDVDFEHGHVHPGPKATDAGGVRCVRGPERARP
jgi:uncharacterized protein